MTGTTDGALFFSAWQDFTEKCSSFVAPEATSQGWLGHFMIQHFGGVERVWREPDFGIRDLQSDLRLQFPGHDVRLDLVVLRSGALVPGTRFHTEQMQRRAGRSNAGGHQDGLPLLQDLSLICELKTAGSVQASLKYKPLSLDVVKLSMLLDEAERHGFVPPTAVACILDNHPTWRLDRTSLQKRLDKLQIRADVGVLLGSATEGAHWLRRPSWAP